MNDPKHLEKRMESRQHVICPAHLTMDSHEFEARSMDFSDGGVRLQTSHPLHIFMRLMIGDREDTREADLVWAKKTNDGKWELGLKYPTVSELGAVQDPASEPIASASRAGEANYPTHSEAMFPPNFFLRMRW